MIDILVPVLGRPRNVTPLVESITRNTAVAHEIHFLCTPGDNDQIGACKQEGAVVYVVPGDDHQYPRKMNYGYGITGRPFVLLAADDIDFQPGWDTTALEAAEKTGVGVVGLNDCANPRVQRGLFSTHPLVRRSYVEEQGGSWDGPGVLVHEGYDHNYTDIELCELAQARGQWAFAPDAKVCHRHPGWQTAADDATYEKGRAHFREDGRLFVRRSRQWQRRYRRRR